MASYSIWDYDNNIPYSGQVNDLPNLSAGGSWTSDGWAAISRFGTAPIIFRANISNTLPQLRLIDLPTGQVLAGREMRAGEFLVYVENSLTPTFYIGEYTNNNTNLKISAYSASLTTSTIPTSSNTEFNFTVPNPFSLSQFVAPATVGGEAYFIGYSSGTTALYRGLSGQAIQSLPLPSGGNSSDSYYGLFTYENSLWISGRNSQNIEQAYRINLSSVSSGNWTQVDMDTYWNAENAATGYHSVIRDGANALDLLTIAPAGYSIENSSTHDLPDGGVLAISQVFKGDGLDSDNWLIYKNGQIVAQKTFNSGAGLSMFFVPDADDADGYVYFEQMNATIAVNAQGEITSIAPGSGSTGSTLYKIALSDIQSVLTNATDSTPLATLAGAPNVQTVQVYTRAQLSNGTASSSDIVFIDQYIAGNNGGGIVFSGTYDFSQDISRNYVSRIEANGTVTRSTLLSEEIEELFIDDLNNVYFLTNGFNGSLGDAYKLDVDTGKLSSISINAFDNVDYGSQIFNVWNNNISAQQQIQPALYDLANGNQWTIDTQEVSRFNTAAIEFHGNNGSTLDKHVLVYDFENNVTLGDTFLSTNQYLLPSVGQDSKFNIGEFNSGSSTLTIKSYDYGPDIISIWNNSPNPDFTFSFSSIAGFDASLIREFIAPAITGGKAFFITGNDGQYSIYQGSNSGQVSVLTSTPFASADWLDNAFIHNNKLWIKANEWNVSRTDFSQTFYSINLDQNGSATGSWTTIADQSTFWDAWNIVSGVNTVIRDGQGGLDLLDLNLPSGTSPQVNAVVDLPSGGFVASVEVKADNSNGPGYEHWVVYKDGAISVQKSFGAGVGLSIRGVSSDSGISDGYAYFQQINATFVQGSPGEITSITPISSLGTGTGSTLYRIALSNLEGVLVNATDASPSDTLIGLPNVELVRAYTRSQLSNGTATAGDVVFVDEYIPVSKFIAGNTGAIVFSGKFNSSTNSGANYISRVEANGTFTSTTSIPESVDEFIVDNLNNAYFLTDRGDDNVNYAYKLNLTTGAISSITTTLYEQIRLSDENGISTVLGTSGNDALTGSAFNDQLLPGLGTNTVDGGAGDDTLVLNGLVGQYTFSRPSATTVTVTNTTYGVVEVDTVTNVEKVKFSDGTIRNLTISDLLANTSSALDDQYNGDANNNTYDGLAGNDMIFGNGGNDTLSGSAGNDRLDGGTGTDTMTGGLGDDTYVVDNANDIVIEAANAGTDTIETTQSYYDLYNIPNVENLTYIGSSASGFMGFGNAAANTMTGGGGNDVLYGDSGNDTLIGNAGNDELEGGLGIDTLRGGLGDDTYVLDVAGDVVTENANEGNDTIYAEYDLNTYSIANLANIENLGYVGPRNANLTGNTGNNNIRGGDGYSFESLASLLGDHQGLYYQAPMLLYTYIHDLPNGVRVILNDSNATALDITYSDGTRVQGTGSGFTTAGAHNNVVTSATITQTINGSTEKTSFTGNLVQPISANGTPNGYATGTVTEARWSNEWNEIVKTGSFALYPNNAGNLALITNSITIRTLGDASEESLVLSGNPTVTVNNNVATFSGAITSVALNAGSGNSKTWSGSIAYSQLLENQLFDRNNNGSNLFDALPISPILGGNDIINGGDGNDTLDPGLGLNTVDGGAGEDILVLYGDVSDYNFSRPTATTVTVTNTTYGVVEVHTVSNIEKVKFIDDSTTPPTEVIRNLTLADLLANTSSTFDDQYNGDANNNTYDGLAGNDMIFGYGGNDTLSGGAGNDQLFGGDGTDTLNGGDGNDRLDGGAGADNMIGGSGDDIYVVDNANEVVTEALNAGTDLVETNLSSIFLAPNVENLTYTGSGASSFSGIGNDIANTITGGGGNDFLYGNSGNDILVGNAGNDGLRGGLGTDTLRGGLGDDTYYLDIASDVVTENANEGNDTIIVEDGLKTYTIASQANIENLQYYGAGNATLTGNTGSNNISGGDGRSFDYFADLLGQQMNQLDTLGDEISRRFDETPSTISVNTATSYDATYADGTRILLTGSGLNTSTFTLNAVSVTRVNVSGTETMSFKGSVLQIGNADPTGTVTELSWTNNSNYGYTQSVVVTGSFAQSANASGNYIDTINKVVVSDKEDGITSSLTINGNATVTYNINSQSDTFAGSITSVVLDDGYGNTRTWSGSVPYTQDIDNVLSGESAGRNLFDVIPTSSLLGGDDIINGGDGNDTLDPGLGLNTVDGGVGEDTLVLDGLASQYNFSRPNATTVTITNTTSGVVEVHTVTNVEKVKFNDNSLRNLTLADLLSNTSSSLDDQFNGGFIDDFFDGLAGNDLIYGNGGNDKLIGGAGNDQLSGGAGNDQLFGGEGNDQLFGEAGNDLLIGAPGTDLLVGGLGSDYYYQNDGVGGQIVESANDLGLDVVVANASFVLEANVAAERLVVNNSYQKNNDSSDNNAKLFTWLGPTYVMPSSTATVNITGSNYTYELLGHDGINTITAGTLAGTLAGAPGGATLVGLGGNDTLTGGEGNDVFFGGQGDDTLKGGLGNDRFYLGISPSASASSVSILSDSAIGGSSLLTSLQLNMSANANLLTGGNDTAEGGDGLDTLVVGSTATFERISETQINVKTATDSMLVNSSVEYVEINSSANAQATIQKYILPFIPAGDEKAIDAYFQTLETLGVSGNYEIAYAPASAFSDLVILDSSSYQLPSTRTFDALAGNDYIRGTYNYQKVYGGAGNDNIYSEGYNNTLDLTSKTQQLYGGDGNDTITVWLGGNEGGQGFEGKTAKLDGGAGDDTYRISLFFDNPAIAFNTPRFDIADSAGKDTLVLAFDMASNSGHYTYWEGTYLKVLTANNVLIGGVAAGTVENIRFSFDNQYFTSPFKDMVLVNPNATAYATGKLSGAATDDALIAMAGQRLNYDGGAGDDLIELNGISGGIAMGGAGKNLITVRDDQNNSTLTHTLASTWTTAGMVSEIDLNYGYSYVVNATGAFQGSDNFADQAYYFANVTAGGANDTIRGSDRANILDGGAGNDVIYSGDNDNVLTRRDTLIGGAGDDILVDQNIGDVHSVLDGGAGNDVYVIDGFTPPGSNITPTKIVERSTTGVDSGGVDVIRPLSESSVLVPGTYTQNQTTITITGRNSYQVGDQALLDFTTGTGIDNNYTVIASTANSFTVNASVAGTTSGSVLYTQASLDGVFYNWLDGSNLMMMGLPDEQTYQGLAGIANNGAYEINSNGTFASDLKLKATIDKNALDFLELGSHDELTAGVRLKVSFDQGTINTSEVIIASSNSPAVLNGGDGTDYILDTLYDDILLGGNGNDFISSLYGRDVVLGGAGDDVMFVQSAGQVVSGGAGADKFVISGSSSLNYTAITDFKYWQGDKFELNNNWLDLFGADNQDWLNTRVNVQSSGYSTSFSFENTLLPESQYLFSLNHQRGVDIQDVEALSFGFSDLSFSMAGYSLDFSAPSLVPTVYFKLNGLVEIKETSLTDDEVAYFTDLGTSGQLSFEQLNVLKDGGYISSTEMAQLVTNAVDERFTDAFASNTDIEFLNVAHAYQDLSQDWVNWVEKDGLI